MEKLKQLLPEAKAKIPSNPFLPSQKKKWLGCVWAPKDKENPDPTEGTLFIRHGNGGISEIDGPMPGMWL